MPTLTLAASALLVQWTDPKALGAGLAAVVLLGVVAALLTRGSVSGTSTSSSASPAGPSGASAGNQTPQQPPPSSPQDLKQRAENADDTLTGGSGDSMADMLASEEVPDTELLSRFVRDSDGDTLGETMTVTEDEVVLKADGEFLAVDPESVIQKDGNLLLDPNVDLDQAREKGEEWRKANFDRMEYDEEGLPEA